jgi:hypothetical protein
MLKYLARLVFGTAPDLIPTLRPVTVRQDRMSADRMALLARDRAGEPAVTSSIMASRMFDMG